MANLDTPFGLKAINSVGSSYAGQVTQYFVPASDSTAIFVGDPVVKTGTANTDGMPIATKATAGAGNAITGVVVSVSYDGDDLQSTYRKASTDRIVFVDDAPQTRFVVQADGAVAVTDIGNNADLVFTNAGSTVYGVSGVELDSTTFGTGATKQVKVVGLYDQIDNEIGANAKLIVTINNHTEANNKAGI